MFSSTCVSVIELASGEYGEDKIEALVSGCDNGKNFKWFENPALTSGSKRGGFSKI